MAKADCYSLNTIEARQEHITDNQAENRGALEGATRAFDGTIVNDNRLQETG